MGQVDVAWPSEDEDFDAKTDAATIKAKAKVASAPVERETTSVAVEEPEIEAEPAEEAEVAAPEEAEPEQAAERPVETTQPEEDQQPEPEAAAEPAADEAPSPAPEQSPAVPQTPKTRKKMGMPSGRLILEGALVLAVILLGLWSWTLYSDRNNLKSQVADLNANPQVAVQKQTQALIDQVSKLLQLPSGETPTVANVTDASQAKQQSAFFANAQNGDKVLMYVKAGEAILYRPSTSKIILVAPLTFTNTTAPKTK